MSSPTIIFSQFSSSGVNPVGSRHLTNHASYVKQLNATTSGALDFGRLNLDSSINHSATKALIARVSNLNGNTQIENLRFWSPARPSPVGNIFFNFKALPIYISGIGLTNASGSIPTALPNSQNLLRQNGAAAITGVVDTDVSEWIYLNVTAENDVTNEYFPPSSNFRYNLTFDYI